MSDALDQLVSATQDRLAVLGQRRAEGMNTLDWRIAVHQVLKDSHLAAGAVARGGFDNLDKSTLGFIGSRLREQQNFLSGLALDTRPGEFDAADLARLQQYGNGAVRGTASAISRRDADEGAMEVNVLSEGSASCDECQELSDQGPVPVGTLPEIGARTCCGNCNCSIELLTADEAAAVEA